MKTKFLFGFSALVIMGTVFPIFSFAQNTVCVILDIQGSQATISCPGQGTRVENLGGITDRYKVGDTIDRSSQPQGQGVVDPRSSADPRSGRR